MLMLRILAVWVVTLSGKDFLALQGEGNMSLECWDSVTLSAYQPERSEYSLSLVEA